MSTSLRKAAGFAFALALLGSVAFGQMYNQTNLVSNISDGAPTIDPGMVNAWGIARRSNSPWWTADNRTGLSTVYTGNGTKLGITVTVPAAKQGMAGTPTGIISNNDSTAFMLPDGESAFFLFCTLDGTIAGWNPGMGSKAMTVVKTTDGSSYTGLTSTMVNGQPRLYAANFNLGTIDIYDTHFHLIARGGGHDMGPGPGPGMGMMGRGAAMGVANPDEDGFGPAQGDGQNGPGEGPGGPGPGGFFADHVLPPHYVPFNVQAIGGDIVVTYALHMPGQLLETDGPGNGYADIYSANGRMLLRLQHGNWLNSPWGVALAPLDFGAFSHDLLVSQFAGGGTTQSSGYIVAYDMTTGEMKGLLEDANGKPLAINGIWGISFGGNMSVNYDSTGAPAAEMYFSAGPNRGTAGIFGYLTPLSGDLIEGNDQ